MDIRITWPMYKKESLLTMVFQAVVIQQRRPACFQKNIGSIEREAIFQFFSNMQDEGVSARERSSNLIANVCTELHIPESLNREASL